MITWVHAKGWIMYQPSTIKIEGCRNHPEQTNPNLEWCYRRHLVVLIQKKIIQKLAYILLKGKRFLGQIKHTILFIVILKTCTQHKYQSDHI